MSPVRPRGDDNLFYALSPAEKEGIDGAVNEGMEGASSLGACARTNQ